jgi:hypothetical protein
MSVTFDHPLTQVSVFPYTGVRVPVKPVVTGASGEYVVGTFGLSVGYQLYLRGGQRSGRIVQGARYFALGKDARTGEELHTHVLVAVSAGPELHFSYVQTIHVPISHVQPAYETVPA